MERGLKPEFHSFATWILLGTAVSLQKNGGSTVKRTCFAASILMLVSINAMGQSKDEITFTKDIAPILRENCQSCHHAGTFAPMSLMTYEETRPWARSIKQKVSAREMPPWFIDKNVGVKHFSNDVSCPDEK